MDYQAKVYDLIGRMSKKIGVEIPREQYPKIEITEKCEPSYNLIFNSIQIPERALNSGNILGEEIGHFLRHYAEGKSSQRIGFGDYIRSIFGFPIKPSGRRKESQTDEFFGYLGRKILEQVTKPTDKLVFARDLYTREHIMNELKRARKTRRTSLDPSEKQEAESYRKEILKHQRAYEFADQVDLRRIDDYGTLFSLPNQEVRHRFFREDPQYKLHGRIKPGKITKRKSKSLNSEREKFGLEQVLKFIWIIGIFVLFILLINMNKYTGYAINTSNNSFNIYLIAFIIFFIFAVIILFNKFRQKKRQKK
ncbi:MAG: hypothetical protein PHF67_01660 [Candidatus Nanoarchaeia archaeon]|nr:hypothetical protein [Candidatus Nanoarchaeia archaeon]